MNTNEHLTDNQLNDYFGNSALKGEAKHQIGRHLLQCDFCLKRLPQPTAEQFWAALMTDENEDDLQNDNAALQTKLKSFAKVFTRPKIFALTAAALAVVLFFSAIIWLNAAKSLEMEKEVAANFETKEPQSVFNQTDNEKINLPSVFPPDKSDDSLRSASTRILSNRDSLAAKRIKLQQNTKTASSNSANDSNARNKEKLPQQNNIALTRGGASPKCGERPAIDLTTEKSGEKVVLEWKRIPNAAKYHLYVSDDEEILLDEFETAEEISYVLKKTLDPQKTYKWKVIITLENGNTIIGDSQKFTVKDLKSNQQEFKKKEKAGIRCSEEK